jgi:NifB/MoaA-like Fe-S oxidoreductase
LLYAADEFYLTAGWPLPPASDYEDFPQLENGVGMASLLKADLEGSLAGADGWRPILFGKLNGRFGKARLPTAAPGNGVAAASLLEPFAPALGRRCGCPVRIVPVVNRFFGETVTVAGLLTGRDLAEQLALPIKDLEQAGFRPDCCSRPICFAPMNP